MMNSQVSALRRARNKRGWSQEQAIVRFENVSRSMGITVPGRASLRSLLSMFENDRRQVPVQYRPVFRELYRATDEDLGFAAGRSLAALPVPPPLPPDLPARVSGEILGYLGNVLDEHVRADTVVGPRYLVPTVQSQMPLIARLCESARGGDRQAVLAIAARYAEFCGWLYQDSGDCPAALAWTNQALDYAHELGDPQVIAYALMRKSNIATDCGEPGHALGLANAALATPGSLSPRTRAACLRQQANAHALLAERKDFEATVDLALTSADHDEDREDLAVYCTPSLVAMEAGLSWVRLGQPDAAVGVFRDSLASWDDGSQTRDRGLCLARLARVSETLCGG